jgi:hypothetical protein
VGDCQVGLLTRLARHSVNGRGFQARGLCSHYIEHIPPDVTAGMFWLKNRDPENWRDMQNVDHRAEMQSGTSTQGRAELRPVLDFIGKGDVLLVARVTRTEGTVSSA